MNDTLLLRTTHSRLLLAPKVGGAIIGFEWNGCPVLRVTPADAIATAAVRRFACYPLIPFSNRIAGASMLWRGKNYPLHRYIPEEPHAIHGNGWQRQWSVRDHGETHALLELDHDACGERALEWPFPYRARQRFSLEPDSLEMSLEIENRGDMAFPFGLGWHPFFPRDAATELGFSARGVWQTDAVQLPTRLVALDDGGEFARSRPIADTTLDNCFTEWTGPAVLCWPGREMSASLSADPACDHLVVFIPPQLDFLAVEPVTHMTDAFRRGIADRSLWCPETGCRVLLPGAGFSCTMRLSLSSMSAPMKAAR